jgi:hypothetical protein
LDFYELKNPQYAFLRRGSKRICPMSQLCGMRRNLIVYLVPCEYYSAHKVHS